jgi:predicted anti-sigma-YlaC factor YlaD
MNCQEMDDRLDGWVDDTLPAAERREVEAHLATCADCREEERRQRLLLTHAAALPRSVSPPRDLWPGIAEHIERRQAWARAWPRLSTWQPALAVAAAVVIALGAVLLERQAPAPVHTVVVPTPATSPTARLHPAAVEMDPGLVAMESDYQAAATALMEALLERKDEIEPETLASVQRNLAVIDAALAEVHRALEKDPNRPELERMLVSTHRKRVDVLRRMVKLSTALQTS